MFVSIEMSLSPCLNVTFLVVVMDVGNLQAQNGLDTAIRYLAQNNLATVNKQTVVDVLMDYDKMAEWNSAVTKTKVEELQ